MVLEKFNTIYKKIHTGNWRKKMGNGIGENNAALREDFDIKVDEIKLVMMNEEDASENLIPIIDGNVRALAFKIADKVQDEAHKLWFIRRKRIIRNGLLELNRRNTYSFTGYMITTSNTQTVLGDIEKCLTYDVLKHMILCLLKQAEDCGLRESFQYRKLKKEYYYILSAGGSSLNRKISKKIARDANTYIENLYMEMSKILH